jgi:eukaryotic-like serine/threonine-protein kinase
VPVFAASGERIVVAQSVARQSTAQLEWFDRDGRADHAIQQPAGVEYINPAISPTGDRVAANRMDPATGNWDVWIIDNARGIQSRVTLHPAKDIDPIWSPDGKDIVFGSNRGGRAALYRKTVDSSEPERLIAELDGYRGLVPTDWSPDGRFILFSPAGASLIEMSVWVLTIDGSTAPIPLLNSRDFVQYGARFSPDGKWYAYSSAESGAFEVYIRPFMRAGPKIQVSRGGGVHPRWLSGGHQLAYWIPDRGIAVADVAMRDTTVNVGAPMIAVSAPVLTAVDFRSHYDAARDGRRFLLRRPTGAPGPALTVMLNWTGQTKN